MAMDHTVMRIVPGLRVGFWNPGYHQRGEPFKCVGHYAGPDLGNYIVGSRLTQVLDEGELVFSVGVLFRPDLNKNQRLETILILENYIPQMFEYEHWESATG